MTLVRLAKEEEGVGISAGAHLAGVKSAMLMQNHGFLASINGIVSCAQLYRIPLLMLISHRGEFGERDPWQTEGGGVTEDLLRALRIPFAYLDHPDHVAQPHPQGADARLLVEPAGRAAAVPRPDVGGAGMMRRLDALKAIYAAARGRGRRHDHGRGRGRAAVDRPPAELLLPAARDGARLVDGARHRAGAAGTPGRRARRRRLGADEPRRPDDAGALPAAQPRPRRVRQREPAVGGRLPDGDVDRQRHRRRSRRRRACRAPRPSATLDASRAPSTTRWPPTS